jgi:hypothetical protein
MVGYIGREGVPHHREPEDMPNDEIPLDWKRTSSFIVSLIKLWTRMYSHMQSLNSYNTHEKCVAQLS